LLIKEKYHFFLEHVRRTLEKKGHAIEGLVWTGDKSPETQYQTILEALRSRLQEKQWHNDNFVIDFVEAWFSVSWEEFSHSIIRRFGGENISLEKRRQSIIQASSKEKISSIEREWQRFKDLMNWRYDPYMQGNLPYILFENNIRMGTPTYERHPFASAEIIPEFRALLEIYQMKGKKHLYINLQKTKADFFAKYLGIWNEEHRSVAIEKLSKEFSGTFFVYNFSMNSKSYYHNKPDLEYCREIQHLITEIQPDTYNITCRDGIDRAGLINALLYWLEKGEVSETVLFVPALIVRQRAIQKHRFRRFCECIKL
jgi:hypothetical protein